MDLVPPSAARAVWPANHRAALVVLIHVDAPDFEQLSMPQSVGLDYTATGLQRLLKLLADLDISATTAWSSRAIAAYPQLARSARDRGHELAVSRVASRHGDQEESMLGRISDIPPKGVVDALPHLRPQEHALDDPEPASLQGMQWCVTGVSGDLPIATVGDDGLDTTIIPVSSYWIDATWLDPARPLPPSSLLEAWSIGLGGVRAEGGLMTIVLHPHISGRPGFAGQVERFLDEAIESGDVWIANAAQVAEWWQQQERPSQ